MSYDPNEFDGPPNPAAIDPAMERMKRMKQELSDTKALLRFQEMHKSAELIKDRERLDWLLKNSCIKVSGLYYTTRESLDEAIRAAESANISSKP